MGWFILARLLFISAIGYVAALLGPIPGGWPFNVAFGVALAALVVVLESRLHEAGLPQLIGALLGGAAGLGIAKTIETALFWANTTDPPRYGLSDPAGRCSAHVGGNRCSPQRIQRLEN